MFRLNLNDCRNFSRYKSIEMMENEQRVQKERYRMRIHPHSRFRVFWETFYCGFVMINLFCSYFYFSIIRCSHFQSFAFFTLTLADLGLVMNIFLNFISGFFEDGRSEAVMILVAIRKKYLKSWYFSLDIIGLILGSPLWCFIRFLDDPAKISTVSTIMINVRFAGLFLRVITPLYYWRTRLSKYFGCDDLMSTLVSYLMVFLPVVYFLSSVSFTAKFDMDKYISIGRTNALAFEMFIEWTLNIFAAGKMINPLSKPFLIMLNMMTVLINYFKYVFLLSVLMFVFWSRWGSLEKYNELFENLNEYFERVIISKRLKLRITKFYEEMLDGRFYDESELLDSVSSEIKEDIISLKIARLREEIAILRLLPINELVLLSRHLVYEVYFGNDVIAYSGVLHDRMYFVARGTIAVYTDDAKELFHIPHSNQFLFAGVHKSYIPVSHNYLACETTVLYSLSRKDYLSICDSCPVFNRLVSFFGELAIETVGFLKTKIDEDNLVQ